jgi:hypothetical protein
VQRSLRELFKNDFAGSAFRVLDGEQRTVGKIIDVEIVEGGIRSVDSQT